MTAFALRAPWYVRERGPFRLTPPDSPLVPPGGQQPPEQQVPFALRDPRAFRPEIQMYDDTAFVRRLLTDPRDSLKATPDDYWSYPVPVTLASLKKSGAGAGRMATSRACRTSLRKLYQASHERFYLLVVEVFCDQPGLPRAGSHQDISVRFVMRRRITEVNGNNAEVRRLATDLLKVMMKAQHGDLERDSLPSPDLPDLWAADEARTAFEADHAEQLEKVTALSKTQGWVVPKTGTPGWQTLVSTDPDGRPVLGPAGADDHEESFPMWRIPPRDDDCEKARSRSLWFGVVPTFSAEHWTDPGADPTNPKSRPALQSKLDEQAIYDLTCFVVEPPRSGRKDCPPTVSWGHPSEPFRLAAVMDPDGTSKRITTITLPDLRTLAARAAKPNGPGGVRVVTPPQSQLSFNPLKGGVPGAGSGKIGAGGGVCTFALELFFIVAFFLFMLFLPVVILAFQLWWMLALRFCFPPQVAFTALADFFAGADLSAASPARRQEFDQALGFDAGQLPVGEDTPTWVDKLVGATDPGGSPLFQTDRGLVSGIVKATDPARAVPPGPAPSEPVPDDPLCPR